VCLHTLRIRRHVSLANPRPAVTVTRAPRASPCSTDNQQQLPSCIMTLIRSSAETRSDLRNATLPRHSAAPSPDTQTARTKACGFFRVSVAHEARSCASCWLSMLLLLRRPVLPAAKRPPLPGHPRGPMDAMDAVKPCAYPFLCPRSHAFVPLVPKPDTPDIRGPAAADRCRRHALQHRG
jgi:hypothetical protein